MKLLKKRPAEKNTWYYVEKAYRKALTCKESSRLLYFGLRRVKARTEGPRSLILAVRSNLRKRV